MLLQTHSDQPQPVAVSLIIVNYNGAALLPDCIDSALQTTAPDTEIVVVDNNSTDASLLVLARYNTRVRIVRSQHNLGFGRACNLGVAAARGDLLVFLNPDVSFVAGWLEPLARAAASDRRIALLCPQMLYPGTPVPTPHAAPRLIERALLPGCGLTARRDAWLMLGGFDETFFLYWEDTELCWRARLLGWRVVSVENSSIYHQRGATTGQFGRWDAERARNSLYTYLKLMRPSRVLGYTARLFAACVIKAIARPTLAVDFVQAWWWNIRHVAKTVRERRALAAQRTGSYRELERLIQHDTRRVRNARIGRSQHHTFIRTDHE